MGRPPIGKQAMTDAERQRRRRAKLWDPNREALDLVTRMKGRGLGDDHIKVLIAAMVRVTEKKRRQARAKKAG